MTRTMVIGHLLFEYFRETSLHGFRHIVDTNKHFTERLFWCICCVCSWCICMMLMRSSWLQAKERPVAFLADTTFLTWNTLLPAVTICETANLYKPNNHTSANEDAVFQEICFFTGQLKFVRYHCRGNNHSCPTTGYRHLAYQIRTACSFLINDCKWNNKPFDCCEYFVPLKTEYGTCYSLNTMQAEKINILETVMNKSISSGQLTFEILTEKSKVFIHSRDDIPNHVMESEVEIVGVKGYKYSVHLSVVVTVSDLEVKDASLLARGCRFGDETIPNSLYTQYSFTSCMISCRQEMFMKLCGCLPHTQPFSENDEITCNMTGLLCVSQHYNELYVLSSKHNANLKKSLQCDCLPSCNNQMIQVLEEINTESSNENATQIKIAVPFLPTEKFTRISVKGTLDVVVAMGSLAGLFLGASLLSVLEFIHFMFFRPLLKR